MSAETIEVDLDPEEINNLVEMFIRSSFLPETMELFDEQIEAGEAFETALYRATVNEVINHVVAQSVQHRQEKSDD